MCIRARQRCKNVSFRNQTSNVIVSKETDSPQHFIICCFYSARSQNVSFKPDDIFASWLIWQEIVSIVAVNPNRKSIRRRVGSECFPKWGRNACMSGLEDDDSLLLQSVHVLFFLPATLLSGNLRRTENKSVRIQRCFKITGVEAAGWFSFKHLTARETLTVISSIFSRTLFLIFLRIFFSAFSSALVSGSLVGTG